MISNEKNPEPSFRDAEGYASKASSHFYDEAYKAMYTKNKKKACEKTKPVTSAVIMKRDRSLLGHYFRSLRWT